MERICKWKSLFFEMTNKIEKTLVSPITENEERERVKLDKIRNEEGRHTNITTDTEEIKNNYERILYATL